MFTPPETGSSERLNDYYGEYLLARLQADPETALLAKGFEKVQNALRQANQTERDAHRRESALVAVRDHADFKLDEAVRQIEGALLGSVSKNRQAREYKACFPDGLTAVVAAPIREEIAAVKRIEAQVPTISPDFKRFLAPLSTAREGLEKAAASLEEASNGHALAMTRELDARRDWIRAYRVIQGELLAQFPDHKRRVESYFRARAGSDRGTTEDAAPDAPKA